MHCARSDVDRFVRRPRPEDHLQNRASLAAKSLLVAAMISLVAQGVVAQNQQNPNFVPSTTVQLPSLGVEIDANGLLSLSVTDPSGAIRAERAAAARLTLPRNVQRESANRKISLHRLMDSISRSLEKGGDLEPDIVHLAGLKRIDRVFLFPDDHDIVIAGPAGGWFEEPSGRVVGLDDRQPLVLLENLIAAIRAFGPQDQLEKVVLCSIDPTPDGLDRFQMLKRQIPIRFTDAEWAALPARMAAAMRDAMGPANVRVQGVPHSSRIAQIMVECDYRMKMIGVGLEPPPTSMITFIEAIDRPIGGFQQWWLRPKYDRLNQDADVLSLKIIGQSIELITNRLEVTAEDRLTRSKTRSSAAADTYAREFTEKYSQIAANCPVFAELQTISDLLVVAAWLKKTDAWQRIGWEGGLLFDSERLPIQEHPVPKSAQCVANAVTKGQMLVTPVGGGFSITPAISLDEEHLKVAQMSDEFKRARGHLQFPSKSETWWWD